MGSGRGTHHREHGPGQKMVTGKKSAVLGREVPLELVMILIFKSKDFLKENFTTVQKPQMTAI